MFLDDEEVRQKVLKDLRDALKANCMESAKIKAADKIKQHLECLSNLEPGRKVKNITKVTTALSRRIVSLISEIHMHLLSFVTGI